MIMSVHVVPSKAASFSLGPSTLNSRPVSSRGESARLVEVPWFARPIYSEEEVEMYPLYSPPATAGGSAAVAAVKNLQKSANHFNYKLSSTGGAGLGKSTESLQSSGSCGGGNYPSTAAAANGGSLPSDPRQWSRDEVCAWVVTTCDSLGLPAPNTDRFLMNGKAVCLMSLAMFIARVPLGGKALYRDFQIRLGQAIHHN